MFEDSQKALASRINDFAASKFNEIDDGPLKNALGGFVGTVFPGALGTVPDMQQYTDNYST